MTDNANASIGQILRQKRLEKGWTLESVTNSLRIQSRFLKALEEERWDELPAQVFLEGFLTSYAHHLGLDAASLRSRLRERLGQVEQPPFTHPSPVEDSVDNSGLPSLRTFVVAAAVALLIGGGLVFFRRHEAPQVSLDRPLNQVVERENVGTSTSSLAGVVLSSAAAQGSEHSVTVRAADPVWVRVRLDGTVKYEGNMPSGDVRSWPFSSQMRLRAGNISRVIVLVDGTPVAQSTASVPGDVVWPAQGGRASLVVSNPAVHRSTPSVSVSTASAP